LCAFRKEVVYNRFSLLQKHRLNLEIEENKVAKYVFWSVLNQHTSVALTENLSRYALGPTFWQAMFGLAENMHEWTPSESSEETDINRRLRMYSETGINRVEIFVNEEGGRYSVQCANSSSIIDSQSEQDALMKYITARAKTSVVNTGEGGKG
jgi:hypothetical protein